MEKEFNRRLEEAYVQIAKDKTIIDELKLEIGKLL